MHSDSYEKAFDRFIDGEEYDLASQAVFCLVRAAFEAGWKSALRDEDEKREAAPPSGGSVIFPFPGCGPQI